MSENFVALPYGISEKNSTVAAFDVTSSETRQRRFDRIVRGTAFGLLGWCGVTALLPAPASIASYFFPADALWLMAIGAVLVLSIDLPERLRVKLFWVGTACQSRRLLVTLVGTSTIVTLLGARIVYHCFALSRDEAMVWFDAIILRHGHLVSSIPERWRPFADALEPRFLYTVAGGSAWVSSYLPGNAALRAVLDVVPGFGLASPLLLSASICAVFGVARQLWPERRDAAAVAALLLVTAPQVIVAAFTPYAMTAHLALDLVWLWLFLRNTLWSHVGAVAIGFLATGLHQIAFHPLFVLPFIVQLWLMRRWALGAFYTLAYGAVGLFWILYWHLMLRHYGLQAISGSTTGLVAFGTQIVDLLRDYDWNNIAIMGKNLTRFLAWQNPFTIPLVVVGVAALRRWDGPQAALVAGLVLTIAVVWILMPSQGHGWGYRYLHGLLGSLCLVAAQGWILVTGSDGPLAFRRLWTQLGVASLFSVLIMLPGRAIEVERFVAPFAAASRAIESASTDLVLVDTPPVLFAEDLVRNDPYLRNRPLVLDLGNLDDAGVQKLCTEHSVSVFGQREAAAFHLPSNPLFKTAVRPIMKSLECGMRGADLTVQ